ncbi:hypothetical protein CMT41_01785 [Colwellia sp. MT41]|nr:hypothetical protein CMT41_01785 [Colwellia sp. MT41]
MICVITLLFLPRHHLIKEELVSIYPFAQTQSNMVELFPLQHQRTVNNAAHQWLTDKYTTDVIIILANHVLLMENCYNMNTYFNILATFSASIFKE